MECTRRQSRQARKMAKNSRKCLCFLGWGAGLLAPDMPPGGSPNTGRPCSNVNPVAHAIDAERGGFLTRQCALSYERLSMLYTAIARRHSALPVRSDNQTVFLQDFLVLARIYIFPVS